MQPVVDKFELRVSLMEAKPQIWRSFTVPVDIKLPELHVVLQIVMGWLDDHLYSFYLRPRGSRAKTRQNWKECPPESSKSLDRILDPNEFELLYEYDFGDSWVHRVAVTKRIPAESMKSVPVCIAGERACPPEDCGGVYGYENLLATLQNPSDPEYEEILEWLGDEFNPEVFDVAEVNKTLLDFWGEDE